MHSLKVSCKVRKKLNSGCIDTHAAPVHICVKKSKNLYFANRVSYQHKDASSLLENHIPESKSSIGDVLLNEAPPGELCSLTTDACDHL